MKIILFVMILLIMSGINYSQQNFVEIENDQNIIKVNPLNRRISRPVNNVCPVQGKEVNLEITQLIYNNVIIGFCCPGCDKEFIKKPEAYKNKLR